MTKIFVTAKPNSQENKIEQTGENQFVVSVKEPPVEGRANAAIVKALRDYFHSQHVRIISGHFSRRKIVEVS